MTRRSSAPTPHYVRRGWVCQGNQWAQRAPPQAATLLPTGFGLRAFVPQALCRWALCRWALCAARLCAARLCAARSCTAWLYAVRLCFVSPGGVTCITQPLVRSMGRAARSEPLRPSIFRPSHSVHRQAGFQLTLQFAHLTLRGAQLVLRGSLLLRERRGFGARLLLLIR